MTTSVAFMSSSPLHFYCCLSLIPTSHAMYNLALYEWRCSMSTYVCLCVCVCVTVHVIRRCLADRWASCALPKEKYRVSQLSARPKPIIVILRLGNNDSCPSGSSSNSAPISQCNRCRKLALLSRVSLTCSLLQLSDDVYLCNTLY